MTDREKLELAAKACGQSITWSDTYQRFFRNGAELGQPAFWQPDTNQADSDRMAGKLRIGMRFLTKAVEAYWTDGVSLNYKIVIHNNTDEDVYRAVREARLLVAAEIGRLK